ncbi:PhnB protein [Anaerosolibacter carboniphilus]|uniref:PhnB protein n=1 Tax=Anaerosolibacter carboniphilus TaxID=1417629 RepID=A0A841KS44_9FIRM|nr:VOC family protein [Anaerosolibacter carboniphilus]MBB6216247.1 PhnB protein [Anaerosolibacter carboniphilus]
MRKIIPEIYVQNCKEALAYYKEIFGGEIKNVQLADGKEMFKGFEGKIIHAELHINDDCVLYLVDIFDEKKENGNINLLLELESEEEINNLYQALTKDGAVKFELQKTFWGAYHAVVTDLYGNTWGLNYSIR